MTWNKTVPVSTTLTVNIPSIFTSNWGALEDILGVEHYTYTSSLSGRHKPGISGLLFAGTTVQINALTSPTSGALAWDTDIGALKRYDASTSSWRQIGLDVQPEVNVYRSIDQSVIAGGGTYTVSFDTETYDTLSNYDSVTNFRFTAPANGFYLHNVQVAVTPTVDAVGVNLSLRHRNSSGTVLTSGLNAFILESTNTTSLRILTVYSMSASDMVDVLISHTDTGTLTIEGGSTLTFWQIHRVS